MEVGIRKIEELYLSGEYLRKNPSIHAEDSAWKAEILKPFLECFVRTHSSSQVKLLDVGGGAGILLRLVGDFLAHSCNCTVIKSALEYSPEMLRVQEANNPDLASITQGSIEEAPFSRKEFDLVLLIDVLEHLAADSKAIAEIARISKFALIKIPLEDNVHSRIVNTLQAGKLRQHAFESVGHVNSYSVRTYLKPMQATGGRVVLKKFTNVFAYFLKNSIYRAQMTRSQYYRNWIFSITSRLTPWLTACLVRDHIVVLIHFPD